ncbi:ATP-binding cassette domain-containing protein, partial [Bradyrhizobium canariense]
SVKIRIEQVRKEFFLRGEGGEQRKHFAALEDITLDVRSGEFLALVGPSGCGKSTLLDLLGGLTLPTSGRILLDGRPIAGPGRDRGIVFQQYALFPWRTVADNVECSVSTSPGSCRSSGATSPGISLTWSACPALPTATRTSSPVA